MQLTLIEFNGKRVAGGSKRDALLQSVADASKLIETCFEMDCYLLLLYPENLTPQFFDLSSKEAGAILQKLRNYHIRLAVVRTASLRLSSRFGDMEADERRWGYFRLFDNHELALTWLSTYEIG
jgi:hypothetical protein